MPQPRIIPVVTARRMRILKGAPLSPRTIPPPYIPGASYTDHRFPGARRPVRSHVGQLPAEHHDLLHEHHQRIGNLHWERGEHGAAEDHFAAAQYHRSMSEISRRSPAMAKAHRPASGQLSMFGGATQPVQVKPHMRATPSGQMVQVSGYTEQHRKAAEKQPELKLPSVSIPHHESKLPDSNRPDHIGNLKKVFDAAAANVIGGPGGAGPQTDVPELAARVVQSFADHFSDEAVSLLSKHIKSVRIYRDLLGPGRAYPGRGSDRNSISGFWSDRDGTLHSFCSESMIIHEAMHAIDLNRTLSSDQEWVEAWNQEINGGTLNEYSRTNSTEGFAEFGRFLSVSPLERRGAPPSVMQPGGSPDIEAKFPKCVEFFRKRKLMKD